jgi:hypothetical protein
MSIFSCLKTLVPQFHAFMDDEQRYNVGATWIDSEGLTDTHNIELKYVRNSERLALQGDPQPDGSWAYKEVNGTVHVISAERVKLFMNKTHENATIMVNMLDKLKATGILNNPIETQPVT